eukprot:gnl/Spiro4/18502_TR9904_c0_g2_i2.p1 gnl/Spiro4/18502_TR9904_c0_g2~~gnl/Spiro4/18502_TR9904_c0_g2_i2.p1  ORF type:complete len:242 (+),score=10.72 gnl/Spiro4/18502_TR9904_c0_g2_i2:78-803(+)
MLLSRFLPRIAPHHQFSRNSAQSTARAAAMSLHKSRVVTSLGDDVFKHGVNCLLPTYPRPKSLKGKFLYLKKSVAFSISRLKGLYTLRHKFVAGFKRKQFELEAKDLYARFNQAYARGDLPALREILTLESYDKYVPAVQSRPPNQIHEWQLQKFDGKAQILQIVICPLPAPSKELIQILAGIRSYQSLMIRNANGTTIGDDTMKKVHEYVVFERNVADSSWKIVTKIGKSPPPNYVLPAS